MEIWFLLCNLRWFQKFVRTAWHLVAVTCGAKQCNHLWLEYVNWSISVMAWLWRFDSPNSNPNSGGANCLPFKLKYQLRKRLMSSVMMPVVLWHYLQSKYWQTYSNFWWIFDEVFTRHEVFRFIFCLPSVCHLNSPFR